VEWYRKAADQGYSSAQVNIGKMYRNGHGGLPQNDALAVEWYRKAADQGNSTAQFNVGKAYQRGTGVPQSYALAAEWWRKAADQGDQDGQLGLAQFYFYGEAGLPQDSSKALSLLRQSAAQGNEMASALILQVSQAAQARRQRQVLAQAFPRGTRVELHSLKAKELNGQLGEVVGFDAASGRCKVKLQDGRGPYGLKLENMKEVKIIFV
jgi:TPR repeat protein